MDLDEILEQLGHERDRINSAIESLRGVSTKRRLGNGRRGRRPGTRLSAAARKKIAESARARWAKAKRAGKRSLKA